MKFACLRLAPALLLVCLTGPSLWAGEVVVLHSGFRIHAERHEAVGDKILLHTSQGAVELDAHLISSYELDEVLPPAPAPVVAAPHAVPEVIPDLPPATPQELVASAARKHGLPPEFVQSVAAVESAYRVQALSPKGAIGLMQLMPGTAAALQADPHDPAQNADAGARLLRELLLQYQGRPELALAAYNAGPGAVARYKGIPPYRETIEYVAKVLRRYEQALKSR